MDRKQLELTAEQGQLIASLEGNNGWKLLRGWLEAGKLVHQNDALSFKYVDDHNGYLSAVARFHAYDDILTFLDNTIKAGVDAQEEITKQDAQA